MRPIKFMVFLRDFSEKYGTIKLFSHLSDVFHMKASLLSEIASILLSSACEWHHEVLPKR